MSASTDYNRILSWFWMSYEVYFFFVAGDWMGSPSGSLNCPPGLEYLASIDQLLFNQKVEYFAGFEKNVKFDIKNASGQIVRIFFVKFFHLLMIPFFDILWKYFLHNYFLFSRFLWETKTICEKKKLMIIFFFKCLLCFESGVLGRRRKWLFHTMLLWFESSVRYESAWRL